MRTAAATAIVLGLVTACRPTVARDRPPPPGTPGVDPGLALAADARVDLVSIVARLAGYPEYNDAHTRYARAVDAHFARFRDHPAVQTATALRRDHGISFNAPVSLAAYLDDTLAPRGPLVPTPAELDRRWQEVDLPAFVAQLQAFARDADLAGFRAAYAAELRRSEAALGDAIAGYRLVDWFAARFGARPPLRPRLVPSLLTGDNNYAARTVGADGGLDALMVIAVGDRAVPRSMTYIVAHELAHSYVNPILDARAAVIAPAAAAVWSRSSARMAAQHYAAAQQMIDESAVRALVVAFARERGPTGAAAEQLAEERRNGFAWIAAMTDALDRLPRPVDPDAMATAVRDVFAAVR